MTPCSPVRPFHAAAALRATGDTVRDELRAAKSEGQAMGVAMKALKAKGATAHPDDVKAVVAAART